MNKQASLRRLIALLEKYAPEERTFVKDVLRESKGTPERFRTLMALRRAVKPETWQSEGPHRLTSVLREHYRKGDPQIFRGAHNPNEPLHLTGSKTTLPVSGIDGSRTFHSGTDHLRHMTPWPNIAYNYTQGGMGMHKVLPGRYSSLTSYSAREFPEIARNHPLDNFTEQYLGLSNAQYRENPKALGEFALKHIRDKETWLKGHPRKNLFKDRIDQLREDWLDDVSSGGFGGLKGKSPAERRDRLSYRFWKLRLDNLKDSGPLDQLRDPTVRDYVLNARRNGLRGKLRGDDYRDDYYSLYEMVNSLRGRRPKDLLMVDQKVPGQYYDVSGLSGLYGRASDAGNSKMTDAIRGLFKKRFQQDVE